MKKTTRSSYNVKCGGCLRSGANVQLVSILVGLDLNERANEYPFLQVWSSMMHHMTFFGSPA